MKKKYIALPKEYLSYSQWAMWLDNPQQYKDKYFDGRDELFGTNAGQAYGKIVADALERGEETGDLVTDAAMLLLKKGDIQDREFRVDLKVPGGWVQLLIKPDTLDSKTFWFGEFKTGKAPWNQNLAQKHRQMHYYALGIYLKYKVIPDSMLAWIATENVDGEIRPTGHVEAFPVFHTKASILQTMASVGRVAREIEVAYAAHVPNKELLEW